MQNYLNEELLMQNRARVTRRQLFGRMSSGLGATALASLIQSGGSSVHASTLPGVPGVASGGLEGLPHHIAKA